MRIEDRYHLLRDMLTLLNENIADEKRSMLDRFNEKLLNPNKPWDQYTRMEKIYALDDFANSLYAQR